MRIVCQQKKGKILNCHLLQIIGGALWVEAAPKSEFVCVDALGPQSCLEEFLSSWFEPVLSSG